MTILMPLAAQADKEIFKNPIKSNNLFDLLDRIIGWLSGFAASLALLAIVVGGIMYVVSFGDENRTRKAKSIIVWAIIGLIVILLAYAVIITVTDFLGVNSTPSGGGT